MSASEVERNQVLVGDARDLLPTLPKASVECIITSPPYFGLRDYGHPAQLGLERNVKEWVTNLRAICRQLARVLRPDGALWLNVGDGYSATIREGAAVKSLLLGPQRLALGLLEDGWIIRNQVVWSKPNAMPNSTRDRMTNRYELLYLLVRQRRYYFDLDSIRVPVPTHETPIRRPRQSGYPPQGTAPRSIDRNEGLNRLKRLGLRAHPLGRNPGDVWEIPTASYHGAHFATFPPRLAVRTLLAGCPERVCQACGIAWQRASQRLHGRLLAVGELRAACRCHAGWRPGLVLDPFMGSGTVALVAEQHRRDWLGIELNPVYAGLTQRRLDNWRESQKRREHTNSNPAKAQRR